MVRCVRVNAQDVSAVLPGLDAKDRFPWEAFTLTEDIEPVYRFHVAEGRAFSNHRIASS